jgi:type II secretory pathway pseudopilin PulG
VIHSFKIENFSKSRRKRIKGKTQKSSKEMVTDKIKKEKAITLIELLVITAIIVTLGAIFSIVVIKPARDRAKDARIVNSMDQIRKRSVSYYDEKGSYLGFCADGKVSELLQDIGSLNGNQTSCNAQNRGYCVSVKLNKGTYWCLDSNFVFGEFQGSRCGGNPPSCNQLGGGGTE